MNYYNDNSAYCCEWLRNLIAAGLIPQGDVDGRPIQEVTANDVKPYTQAHFFAGVGGWPIALRLAGWPDDRPMFTGSCPCPPFSVAGEKKECPECGQSVIPCPRRTGYFICSACEHAWFADGRHLWPEFWRLIADCHPPTIMGEQVAGADGRTWFAGVRASLEICGYAVGAANITAAGVGAPHIRSRLYWVASRLADALGPRLEGRQGERGDTFEERAATERDGGGDGGMGDTLSERDADARRGETAEAASGMSGEMGEQRLRPDSRESDYGTNFWSDYELAGPDRDGKYRRVKPGIRLLASGVPARISKLRALGNAICVPLAAEVIKAYMEISK